MKRFLLLFVFTFGLASLSHAVAVKEVTKTTVTFYNWSQSPFDMDGMHLTIGATVLAINNLTIGSGTKIVPPMGEVKFTGLSIPESQGSLALWYSNAFPGTPSPFDLASFVQWGAAGQDYESTASSAGLWTVGTFVMGALPILRDGNYTSWGASHWTSTVSVEEDLDGLILDISPNPFIDVIAINTFNGYDRLYSVSIVNAVGKTVYSDQGIRESETKIDARALESGVYLIRIQTLNGGEYVRRIIKN